jgi:hypothetical protein
MQRLRTGLAGLGMVFLMTFAASLLADAAKAPDALSSGAEPLAMLGVAPSSEPLSSRRQAPPAAQPAAGSPSESPERVTI